MARMRRFGGITAVYAAVAALVMAAPLAASEEPVPAPDAVPTAQAPAPAGAGPASAAPAPTDGATAPTDGTAAPTEPAPTPTGSAPAPTEAAPAPAEPAPAPPSEAVAEPAPATPEPQVLRDDARVGKKPKPIAVAAASTGVTISDFQFSPSAVTVNVGDTVTWTNAGPTPHSATANDGSFDTGIMDEGASGSHTFTEAGTFSYICTPHPNMTGTVTVQAAAADEGSGTGGEDTGSTGGTSTGSQADDGPSLPASGMDVGGLALLGLMTFALGAYLRRRTEPEPARPAGRIGW
jgi:plastocyanin